MLIFFGGLSAFGCGAIAFALAICPSDTPGDKLLGTMVLGGCVGLLAYAAACSIKALD